MRKMAYPFGFYCPSWHRYIEHSELEKLVNDGKIKVPDVIVLSTETPRWCRLGRMSPITALKKYR